MKTTRQPKTEKFITDEAAQAGAAAFAAGKCATPARDAAVMEIVKKYPGNAIAILDAWSKAWHKANLAEPFFFNGVFVPMPSCPVDPKAAL